MRRFTFGLFTEFSFYSKLSLNSHLCINTSCIPEEWEEAIITPIYKKKGFRQDIDNYRPISVLPPIAKEFERLICDQIYFHLKSKKYSVMVNWALGEVYLLSLLLVP